MNEYEQAKLTQIRIEHYQGKEALLRTWEAQDPTVVANHKDYLRGLRKKVRQLHLYILNRKFLPTQQDDDA
jgi:hypothetical protein